MSVKQIAARVGLTDMSHFVCDFQQRYGLSPLRYRRRYWEKAVFGVLLCVYFSTQRPKGWDAPALRVKAVKAEALSHWQSMWEHVSGHQQQRSGVQAHAA